MPSQRLFILGVASMALLYNADSNDAPVQRFYITSS